MQPFLKEETMQFTQENHDHLQDKLQQTMVENKRLMEQVEELKKKTEKKEFQHESPYQLRSNVLLPRFYMLISQEHIQIRTNPPTNQSHYKMPVKKCILANVLSVFEAAQWTSFQETSFPEEIQLLKKGNEFMVYIDGSRIYVSDFGIDPALRNIHAPPL